MAGTLARPGHVGLATEVVRRSLHDEVGVLAGLVVARQVADEGVVAGLEVQPQALRRARLDLADLADVAGLVGLGALEKVAGRLVRADDDELVLDRAAVVDLEGHLAGARAGRLRRQRELLERDADAPRRRRGLRGRGGPRGRLPRPRGGGGGSGPPFAPGAAQ